MRSFALWRFFRTASLAAERTASVAATTTAVFMALADSKMTGLVFYLHRRSGLVYISWTAPALAPRVLARFTITASIWYFGLITADVLWGIPCSLEWHLSEGWLGLALIVHCLFYK
jgi:hypothetical protein